MSNFISLDQAIALTRRYRKEKETILVPDLRDKGILPICETFERISFETLLNEKDCQGIRIYLGMGEDEKVRVLAVGVNSKNEDILPAKTTERGDDDDDDGDIVEDGQRCPDICPPPSDLNEP